MWTGVRCVGLLLAVPRQAGALQGCTDKRAANYDVSAIVDSGACVYGPCTSLADAVFSGTVAYAVVGATNFSQSSATCLEVHVTSEANATTAGDCCGSGCCVGCCGDAIAVSANEHYVVSGRRRLTHKATVVLADNWPFAADRASGELPNVTLLPQLAPDGARTIAAAAGAFVAVRNVLVNSTAVSSSSVGSYLQCTGCCLVVEHSTFTHNTGNTAGVITVLAGGRPPHLSFPSGSQRGGCRR